MAKVSEIIKLQNDFFAPVNKDTPPVQFSSDSEDIEKYLSKVEKKFIKQQREDEARNRKAYMSFKIDSHHDELFLSSEDFKDVDYAPSDKKDLKDIDDDNEKYRNKDRNR
jgi:hypothetical protein